MSPFPPILPLAAEDLTFDAAGRRLIDGLSFTIVPGGPTLILGPNGAGKSLLLRLLHGLLQPTGGRVAWHGAGQAQARWRQAMVFQRPVMLRRSAIGNIEYALAVRGIPRRQRREIALDALERAGLRDLAERPARVLSGGEQQRLALARAWAVRPQVLFLDEPTASLDPGATRQVEALVRLFADSGIKIVMTTHDMGQARRLADEVLFLHRGRLYEQTPAESFFRRPATGEAAAFVMGELLW